MIHEIPEEYISYMDSKEITEENIELVKLLIWQEEIRRKISEGETIIMCKDYTGQYFFQYDQLQKIFKKIY